MEDDKQAVKETEDKIVRLNYNQDKNGWVTFNNKKKKKVKLRVFISTIAKDIAELDDSLYAENRRILIEQYNKGGLKQVQKVYQETVLAVHQANLAELSKEADELLKTKEYEN